MTEKEKEWPACRFWLSLIILVSLTGISGCARHKNQEGYLARVHSLTLTTSEFKEAVAAAGEEAFPGEQSIAPADLSELRLRVLNQLTEEMVISAFAADRKISINDAELDKAVSAIRADYPDNTFEETLLENAIPFQFWKKQLATRLLIEKVISQELIDQVQITPEDVSEYCKIHYPEGLPPDETADVTHQKIVTHLRRLKAEKVYKEWMDQLRGTYAIEINQQEWDRLMKESS